MKRILIASIALLPLLGCASKRTMNDGSISGTITYKGQPVNGALLRFHATGKEQELPAIAVDQQGKFTAVIPPGEYIIVVEPSQGPPKGAGAGGMGPMPKSKDSARDEEMKRKLAGIQGSMPTATIPFPNKYKKMNTTDLKATIVKGDNTLTLELKDK